MENKRLILAVVLSIAVWVGWYLIFKPETRQQETAPVATEEKAAEEVQKTPVKIPKQKGNVSISLARKTPATKEDLISLETEKYSATLTSRGAAVKTLLYKEREIDLVVEESSLDASGILDFSLHFDDNEFINGNVLDESIWSYRKAGDRAVTFFTTITINNVPVQIEKIYAFNPESYAMNIEYRVKNLGREELTLSNGNVIISPSELIGPNLDLSNRYNNLNGFFSSEGDFDKLSKGGFFSKKGPLKKEAGSIEWFGVMSRYCLVLMKPNDFTGTGIIADNREDTGARTGMYVSMNNIAPNQSLKRSFTVYLGEKNKKKLATIDKSLKKAADISRWIEPIRFIVIWALLHLNDFIGNMGWSLVIFSLITKVIFMPLTIKSTESMKRMQKLTPKMNEIKAKYKDKPEVMQKEMMKLYKENNVNPMGGCFPLLLQMPFFIALYSALINSIDLWNAPFILWIKDLSMPDTVATISGFNINILPILMTVTSFLQQKLTTVDTGGQQQKMMTMMMPVILIFIFWNMPSGLVLYWALQNIFQVLHQLFTNWRAKLKES